ncbi:hypothetical protein ACFIOY_26940 [Bradyrhizobium sp. TZ2]
MALHRDIHWIGRQWAVTGHGMQLIDQKLQGFFDIEAIRLWDESLIETMRAKEWLNATDFDKGLAVARARYPQSPHAVTPLPEAIAVPAIKPIAPFPLVAKPEAPKRDEPPKRDKPDLIEPPPDFQMRFDGSAKFVHPWRVWMKRQT